MNPLLGDLRVAVSVLALGLIFDIVYPYHKGLALKIHPVHTSFMLGKKLVRPYASKSYGIMLWSVIIGTHFLPVALGALLLLQLSNSSIIFTLAYVVFASWILKLSSPIALLVKNGISAYRFAVKGDWRKTRDVVQGLVRRNLLYLANEDIISACIESLAESLVDGFTSPLTYYSLFGVPGSFLQRLSNTLDGLVGFKTPELYEEGWFSAKVDTLLNYLPARLTALYIAFSAFILKYDWKNSLRIWIRDRNKTESLNAGNPMSAMAGALRGRLRKPGYYALGDSLKPLEPEDIKKAVKVVVVSAFLHLLIVMLIIYAIQSLI